MEGAERLAWVPEAKQAIAAGSGALHEFLNARPPSGAGAFLSLFEYVYDYLGRSDDVEDTRYSELYQKLDEFDKYGRRGPNDTTPEKDRRDALEADKSIILFYDVFRQSMLNWQSIDKQRTGSTSNTAPVTRIIWRVAQNKLYNQGAIHACAEYGQEELLFLALHKLQESIQSPQEAIKVLFQPGPRSDSTPLGMAIRGQHTECVRTLAFGGLLEHGDMDIANYVLTGNCVLSDNEKGAQVLHETLKRLQSAAGVRLARGRPALIESLERSVDIVQAIIQIDSRLLCQKDRDGNLPYKRAQDIGKIFNYSGLEDVIKEEIFRLQDPDLWRAALYDKHERDKEIGLVLSDFSYDSHHFGDFVSTLEEFSQSPLGKNWQFWETLLYLDLPPLTARCEQNSEEKIRCDEKMVATFLKWLNEEKKVTKIIKLKLPDSEHRYSSNFVDEEILKRFQIDELDWLVVDIDKGCIENLGASNANPMLKKLHLYSRGQESQVAQLAEVVGIIKRCQVFHEVTDINVSLVDPPKSEFRNPKKYREKANALIRRALGSIGMPEDITIQYEEQVFTLIFVEERFLTITLDEKAPMKWDTFAYKPRAYGKHESDETQAFQVTHGLEECHHFLEDLSQLKGTATTGDLKHCLEVLKNQKVKVAIIDNGVDQMRGTISDNIEYGRSFVKDGLAGTPYLPWCTAADPHGTQMAYLVRNVNPYCRIYPLRAGSLREDIDPDAAAQAIEWAMDHDIDIISISWIVKSNSKRLENAITAATQKGLVFCSTADIGAQSSFNMWPVDYRNVVAVSASNIYGLPLLKSSHDVHAMLHGDEVPAHGPNYMRSYKDTRISGSSVATALAAGLASLCLFLARMANSDGKAELFKERRAMLWLLRKMQVDDRVVVPSKLFQDFDFSDAFYSGQGKPPNGLDSFKYSLFEKELQRSDFRTYIPQRSRSRDARITSKADY